MQTSMVSATPKRRAIGVQKGAIARDARPATAEFAPIISGEIPCFSIMKVSSGNPRPSAIPTELMAAIAAAMGIQRIGASACCVSDVVTGCASIRHFHSTSWRNRPWGA